MQKASKAFTKTWAYNKIDQLVSVWECKTCKPIIQAAKTFGSFLESVVWDPLQYVLFQTPLCI